MKPGHSAGLFFLGVAAVSASAAQAVVPPPPIVTSRPSSSQSALLTWSPGEVGCAGGSSLRFDRLEIPSGYRWTAARKIDPISLEFKVDAEGRPHNIRYAEGALRHVASMDLMPSLAASQFVATGRVESCSITYSPAEAKIAEVELNDIARYGIYAGRTKMTKQERVRFADGDCRSFPRPDPLLRAYPDFRTIPDAQGAKRWSFMSFDLDGEGKPINVRTVASSGNPDMDKASREAVEASRYAATDRTGCLASFWKNATVLEAPAAPDTDEFGESPEGCDADSRWAKKPRLVFPRQYSQRAINGWAIMRYDVAPWGEIGNIEVLQAEPTEEFGTSANGVLRSARFKPQEAGLKGCIDKVVYRMRGTPDGRDDGGDDSEDEVG